MARGKELTETIKNMVAEMFEDGNKDQNDIARRLNISYASVHRILQDKGLIEKDSKIVDLSSIEEQIEELPDVLIRRIKEVLEFSPNLSEYLLSLESIGFKSKDKKCYVKIDGNQSRQVVFHNANQITYSVKDLNGRETERYFFNAETIEAMCGAILDRGWNYFKNNK